MVTSTDNSIANKINYQTFDLLRKRRCIYFYVLCVIRPKNLKTDLHNMYSHKRGSGKWFCLNLPDLKKSGNFMRENLWQLLK